MRKCPAAGDLAAALQGRQPGQKETQESEMNDPDITKKHLHEADAFFHVRDKIRTRDLLVRSQTLYPAELHVHFPAVSSTASMIIAICHRFVNRFF